MADGLLRPLIRKLGQAANLTSAAEKALLKLQPLVKDFRPDEPIVREGDRPTHVAVVITGFVYRYKMVDAAKRQIIAFHIPGDMPDLQGLHLDVMDHGVATCVHSQIAFIPHATIFPLMEKHPSLAHSLWREAQIDSAIFREWVVNVGRREGPSRTAHLFCEMLTKAKAVGLSEGDQCDLPVSQTELADATGMSAVHLNRVVQQLRQDNLIRLHRKRLSVLDWERLKELGDFDPTYLHLKRAQDGSAAGESSTGR